MVEKGVATLERALTILAAFSPTEPQLSLAELSRRTGLYKSTLLRLLVTLERFNYVAQGTDGSYHVGPAAFYLGSIYQRSVKLPKLIEPVLQRLVERTGESASFNVAQGEVRVCVYRIDSPHTIRDHVQVGDVLPMSQGAVGHALSAFLKVEEEPTEPLLKQARIDCLVHSHGEVAQDMAALAAPVFRAASMPGAVELAGCLAVTGPTSRFNTTAVAKIRQSLLQEAAELSYYLGGRYALLEAAAQQATHEAATAP